MGYINIPPSLKDMFDDIINRLRKLETATRFTAPNVATNPTNPRKGDIWLDTTSNTLEWVDATSVVRTLPANAYQFSALYSAATPCTAGNNCIFDNVQRNVGSAYDNTNGRFTAPVAGTYYFTAHGLYANADAGDMRMAFLKNNLNYEGAIWIDNKIAATWLSYNMNATIVLAAGDFVTVRYIQGSTALYGDTNYNGFQGWLVA